MCDSETVRLGALCALLLPSLAAASSGLVPDIPPAPPAQVVRELLELDARRALATELAKSLPALPSVAPVREPPGESTAAPEAADAQGPAATVLLRGIYGLGPHLQVEMGIGNRRVVYRAGQPTPIAGDGLGFRLANVALPCVALTDPAGQPLQRCLEDRRP